MRYMICVGLIVAMFGYSFIAISHLPHMIPIHFSNGEADEWGSIWISLLMPVISLIFYVGLLLNELYLKKNDA